MLGERNDVSEPARPDRRQARRDATRAEILAAAWELAGEQGLASISLRDLADRVGMRAPSLYQYFASKNDIYDAMFKQGAEQALVITQAPMPSSEPHAILREMTQRFFDFCMSDHARAQLLFFRSLPGFVPSPEAYAPAEALVTSTTAMFAELGIKDPDALDLYTALVNGIVGQQLANDPEGNRWGRLIDRAVDMYLALVLQPTRATTKNTTKKKGNH